jgi:glutamate synthase (NADPH) small chain
MEDKYKEQRQESWRTELRKSISAKERTAIDRTQMPEEDPNLRNKSNIEVNKGLTVEQALLESQRCLDCVNPTCISGCPVEVNIPTFIKHIENKDFIKAAQTIKETSALPAVCGRVCPQEKQCESQCIYTTKMNKPAVAIGYLERFAADYEIENGIPQNIDIKPNGIKVAVAGSGPAGLTFAGDMAKYGYEVTVFEALHEIGGVLKYGIPEFRLPNYIVEKEIENLRRLGVTFETNVIIGKTITLEELQEDGFKGMFVGSGAGLPRFMNIPGENLVGIFSANEYLTRINLMNAGESGFDTPVLKGKNVAVIGGGNTAMDAVRTAKRQGAERAMIIYRRTLNEMPARIEEVHHAQEEGVEFIELTNPIEYIGNDKGRVESIIVQKMQLGEPDASGRRSPITIKGSEYKIDIDIAIVSIGVSPNPIVTQSIPDLKTDKWGTIIVDEKNMQTSIPFIFAGGDIVRGGATVIMAMGDGKKAAKSMDEYIKSIS